MRDVLAKYGYSVDSHGFCKCMLHEGDNTASFKVYPDNTYHCFGCGAHGDVISFVQMYLHCDFKTAFYELGGSYERPKSLREKREQVARFTELEKRKKEKAADLRITEETKNIICLALSEIHRLLPKYEVFSDSWVSLVNEKAMLHDALMQIAERGTLTDGVFSTRIKRYMPDE